MISTRAGATLIDLQGLTDLERDAYSILIRMGSARTDARGMQGLCKWIGCSEGALRYALDRLAFVHGVARFDSGRIRLDNPSGRPCGGAL